MTRAQAHANAHALWGTRGSKPGDRVGFVVIRRKNIVDRFEVGYYTRGSTEGQLSADTGATLSHGWIVMGKGSSWEEAFERAAKQEGNLP